MLRSLYYCILNGTIQAVNLLRYFNIDFPRVQLIKKKRKDISIHMIISSAKTTEKYIAFERMDKQTSKYSLNKRCC